MKDYRLNFGSYKGMSFLEVVKENKEELDYFISTLNTSKEKNE